MSISRVALIVGCVAALIACSSSSTNEANGVGGAAGGGGVGGGGGGGVGGGGGGIGARCDSTCDLLVKAACSNGLTKPACLVSCKALTSSSKCDPTGNAYFDCVAGKTATCNAAGDPEVAGCAIAYLNSVDCAVSENPNPSVVTPCATYCAAIAAKGCAKSAPEDECNTNCLWAGATGIGCAAQWSAFLACANKATLACLAEYPTVPGCGLQFLAYTKCVNAAGAS